jgi:hypothetical protein
MKKKEINQTNFSLQKKVGSCYEKTFNHFDENSDDIFIDSLCRYRRMFITGSICITSNPTRNTFNNYGCAYGSANGCIDSNGNHCCTHGGRNYGKTHPGKYYCKTNSDADTSGRSYH